MIEGSVYIITPVNAYSAYGSTLDTK